MIQRKHFLWRVFGLGTLVLTCSACGDDSGKTTTSTSGGAVVMTICDANQNVTDLANEACSTLPDDYTPRDAASANDTWPACVSDKNQYEPFGGMTNASAHVQAFEDIAKRLQFGGLYSASPDDFAAARAMYSAMGGIASRLPEIEDDHYPAAPKPCFELTAQEQAQYPFRCVGSIRIKPVLEIAFDAGTNGEEPILNAARIEGGLLWFLYMSTYERAVRAAENAALVDEAWATYSGGYSRENPVGLAKYVFDRNRETHERIWDGLLAVRCWRDLDNPQGPAMDLGLQSRALEQLDRALLHGMASILRQRIQVGLCEPAWESAEVLGGVLLREAKARDATMGNVLEEEISRRRVSLVDAEKLTAAIDVLFPCP